MVLAAGPKDRNAVNASLPRELSPLEFATACYGTPYQWQAPLVDLYCSDARPRISYVQVGRKNGKSFLGASVALDALCRRGEQVFLIADSERNLKSALFHEIKTLVARSPVLSKAVLVYKDHLECPATGGQISLRPNNLGASQSINPDVVLFDEVHMQKTDSIWNGMALAGAAMPHALLLGITTPGYDVSSPAHDLYQLVKAGKLHGVIHEPEDPNCALDDVLALKQANPVLLDRPDMLDVFAFERENMPEHDFRRFRLGQWTTTASGWLPYGRWAELARDVDVDPAEPCWLGFDGSYSGDSTALVLATAGGHLCVVGCWENPGRKGWRVPRADVMDAVAAVFAERNVMAMFCDPPYWGREIAEWSARYPGRIVEFPTFSRARMAPACTTFYTAAMDGRMSHDGNLVLARHVANCVVRPSPQGDYVTKASQDSPAKIDAAIAAVLAFQGAATHQPVTRRRVYML